jgi:hypothetical protein
MNCQREACLEQGNHTVSVVDPAGVTAVSEVCFDHARSVKVEATRSRPRPFQGPDVADTVTAVECGNCRIPFEEASSLSPADRQPCPVCGSVARHVAVTLHDTLGLSAAINAKVRRFGRGTIARVRSEDSFTHDLQARARVERLIDREHDLYVETIVLWDETTIETRAKLTDHQPG